MRKYYTRANVKYSKHSELRVGTSPLSDLMHLKASENPELRRPQARRVFDNVAAFIASTDRLCPGGWAASFLCWSYSRLDSQISGAQWVRKRNVWLKYYFATAHLYLCNLEVDQC